MKATHDSSNAPIRIAHIDLSFHAASAAVVQRSAEHFGATVTTSTAPHEQAFQQLAEGAADVLVSAWLPASHGQYLAPIEADVVKVTTLYEPYCIWAVPDYVPAAQVSRVRDLLDPAVAERMDKTIQGINPGAGISRFSAAIVEHYGLDAAGYRFQAGTEEDCFGRVRRGVPQKDWFVVPLWHPQFLHHRYTLRPLEEPIGLLGGKDAATLIVRRDALERLPAGLFEFWQALQLGNDRVSALDHQISVEGIDQRVVAGAWLEERYHDELIGVKRR